jgi:hypothetical protein
VNIKEENLKTFVPITPKNSASGVLAVLDPATWPFWWACVCWYQTLLYQTRSREEGPGLDFVPRLALGLVPVQYWVLYTLDSVPLV